MMTNTVHQSKVLTVPWNPGIVPDLEWRATVTVVEILDMVAHLPIPIATKPQLLTIRKLSVQIVMLTLTRTRLLAAK